MGDRNPLIATVIPVLNEEKFIAACIDSLMKQSLPPSQHMILILDGGSTDSTRSIVENAIRKSEESNGPVIELHDNPGKYVAEARNLAMSLLPKSVEFTVELIGHCTVEPSHLQVRMDEWTRLSKLFPKPLAALGVLVMSREGVHGTYESWIEGALSSPFGSGNGQFESFTESSETKVPAFAMHSRSALTRVNGWDPEFITSQDSDLSMRLLEHGYAVARTAKTYVRMAKRSQLANWWKMGHRYGFWRMKTVRKHPTRASIREFLPWFGLVMTICLMLWNPNVGIVLPSLYLFVLLAEGLRSSIKTKRITAILGVPLCLLMLHTSFSIGLLDGIFRKGRAPNDR